MPRAPCCSSSAFVRLKGRDPKKPRARRQRARMRGLDAGDVREQVRPERLRPLPPQDRDERAAALGERRERTSGHRLPAPAVVRAGRAGAHGEVAVQQQHPAIGPRGEVAVRPRAAAPGRRVAPGRCSRGCAAAAARAARPRTRGRSDARGSDTGPARPRRPARRRAAARTPAARAPGPAAPRAPSPHPRPRSPRPRRARAPPARAPPPMPASIVPAATRSARRLIRRARAGP